MENQKEADGFSYTYSAKEQDELKKIRQKYIPKEEDKMEQLLRLDRSVYEKSTMVSIILGVVGALTLSIGMCCAMVWQGMWFIPGIIIGVIGIGIVTLAYPVYNHVVKKERKKITPEILRLTDELMK